jgi:hypothetical protein
MPLGIAWELDCPGTHGRRVKGDSWEREFQTRCQWNVKGKNPGGIPFTTHWHASHRRVPGRADSLPAVALAKAGSPSARRMASQRNSTNGEPWNSFAATDSV